MRIPMELNAKATVTSKQLAEYFIGLGSDEQAEFLNLIGESFKKADFNAEMQCCWLAKDIDKNGRDFIYTVANFVKVRGVSGPKVDTLINSYPGEALT
jgi:hypothetical protein